MEKNNASKKLTLLALVLFVILTVINVFWIITMYIPYCGYSYSLADVENNYPTLVTEKQEGEYVFVISEAPYLGYDDFLKVAIKTGSNAKGFVISDLFVYPNIWGDYEYFVGCTENDDYFFMIEIDDLGNFIPNDKNDTEFNNKAQQILKENHSDVMQFLKIAKDCWGLEAKHDLVMGIKGLVNGQPFFTLITTAIFICFFCLIISVFIWLLKYKIPFQKYAGEMDAVNGIAEFDFKRIVGDYEFYMSSPRFLRNDGFLMIQKHQFSADRISLIIYPRKKETTYFVFINDSKCLVRKADKIKLEYIKGKVICGDKLVLENNEKIEDLIIQSSLFWGVK